MLKISIVKLKSLQTLHLQPINVVVFYDVVEYSDALRETRALTQVRTVKTSG